MKVAIMYNKDMTGVINQFGMQNKEIYGTFYYFLGRFEKPQRDAEKNNNPLLSSASSAVNLF